jgi:hypothetical protein
LVPGAMVISFGPYANFAISISTVGAGAAALAKIAGAMKDAQTTSASKTHVRSEWAMLRKNA